ncbi:MAG: FadR family transcriptional regulator, partial [Actinobacteria bacterium]|nr:FadR family transcriptional regulator [Actinomycetota bacterium]
MSQGNQRSTRPVVRFQRLAEQVADDLRRRILNNELPEDSSLPVEELLRAEYPVSKPTLREAMRVLEAEGLITVRRGSIGGAVIHRPTSDNVAYTLGLVLASQGVDISDVAAALREAEPACAAACAERSDRHETVVPRLRELYERSVEVADDFIAVTAASRQFHEAVVQLCGNASLASMAGALESLWSTHEADWAKRSTENVDIPVAERLEALKAHLELLELIEAGDAAGARAKA